MVGKFVQIINNNNNNSSGGNSSNATLGIRNPIALSTINNELKPHPDDLENDPRGRIVVSDDPSLFVIKIADDDAEYKVLINKGQATLDTQGKPTIGKAVLPYSGDKFFLLHIIVFDKVVNIFQEEYSNSVVSLSQ